MSVRKARLQAKDETIAPQILTQLAISKDRLTRRYVARNPNTPVETLSQLGEEFPEDIVENHIFRLLFVENLDSEFIKLCLARSLKTPPETLEKFVDSDNVKVKEAIAKHPHSTSSILEKLAAQPNQEMVIYSEIAKHHHISDKIVNSIIENTEGYYKIHHIYQLMLSNPQLSSLSLEKLATNIVCGYRIIEHLIIQHPNLSQITREIVEFRSGNKTTPDYILEKIANSQETYIRCLAAGYSNIPGKILYKLARDHQGDVRECVAKNSNISIEFIEKLSKDKDNYTRVGISKNPNTPPAILAKLARSKYCNVRGGVASNFNTPLEILNNFKTDTSEYIRKRVAKNPNISLEIMEYLVEDPIAAVRQSLAENPKTPANILKILKADKSECVRQAVAENKNAFPVI